MRVATRPADHKKPRCTAGRARPRPGWSGALASGPVNAGAGSQRCRLSQYRSASTRKPGRTLSSDRFRGSQAAAAGRLAPMPASVDRGRLRLLLESELTHFREANPRSAELHERALGSLVGGVPMPWMMRWAGGFPVTAAQAHGQQDRRRRRARVHRPVPRRHGRDDRPRLPRAAAPARRPRRARPDADAADTRTRPGSARSSRGGSGSSAGCSPSPPPTRTGRRFAFAARSPAARRCWCTPTATTAPSMRRSRSPTEPAGHALARATSARPSIPA